MPLATHQPAISAPIVPAPMTCTRSGFQSIPFGACAFSASERKKTRRRLREVSDTINGAKALGLDQKIGSLETGKYADIVAIDFGTLESSPVYHPVSHIIYNCNRNQITDVWIAGKHLLKDRALTTLDEQKILRKTAAWNDKISGQTQI